MWESLNHIVEYFLNFYLSIGRGRELPEDESMKFSAVGISSVIHPVCREYFFIYISTIIIDYNDI